MIRLKALFYLLAALFLACAEPPKASEEQNVQAVITPTNKVLLSSEIKWEALNPARGDQSPKAGTIWGDRKAAVATGFLAQFVDGFSSPPHIHNVSYRALVLEGLVHNDDPAAEKMWMPKGSFWTQPAGEAHITAAKGVKCIAYVEIDSGPYLVKPTEEAFDNGERPVNIDIANMVWLDDTETTMLDAPGVSIAFLWEEDDLSGNMLKLPPGLKLELSSEGEVFHAVVISGQFDYEMPLSKEVKSLDAGSYFRSTAKAQHLLSTTAESLLYIRTNGELQVRTSP
ncbi:MAG: DUF4437 domain-containing protein [Bacteroidota bacterium]